MTANTSKNSLEISTPSDREIGMTRWFDAPRKLVYQVCTDPKHLPHWMLGPEGWTMPVCESDLRPGGKWHFVWRKADGTEMSMTGSYREVVPPEKLVLTERWGGDWPETINTMIFTEENGRTKLYATILYPSMEARDRALNSGMKDGAVISYDRMAKYIATL